MRAIVDKYEVNINADFNTNEDGQVTDREADLFLCVYDVRNNASVDFLKTKVICDWVISPIAF